MQLVGAADSTAVVGADPPTPPGLFPRGRYSTSVEWLSARHRESGIGSYADQEHPDQVGWHLADPEWYPSDLVRREYKRLAIGANYEGPFALQLIMAAAPPAVAFAWEVQRAEDSFRHSLHNTLVGKGQWNNVACLSWCVCLSALSCMRAARPMRSPAGAPAGAPAAAACASAKAAAACLLFMVAVRIRGIVSPGVRFEGCASEPR